MRFEPINPPLSEGYRVLCSWCGHWASGAMAILDGKPFTYVCDPCIEQYHSDRQSITTTERDSA